LEATYNEYYNSTQEELLEIYEKGGKMDTLYIVNIFYIIIINIYSSSRYLLTLIIMMYIGWKKRYI